MTISLTQRQETLIRQKVDAGLYNDASEVVDKALQLLDERDRLSRLKAALAVGHEQYLRGEGLPWTPDSMDQLIREADEEDRLGLPISDDVQP
jgi:antitoxin ParD1/3/4